jgi:hypothetical protein
MQLEAELAKPARFKEPSAAERARMAAAARTPDRRAGRKARSLRSPAPQPDPWRSASLPVRRRIGTRLVTALIVIVILGGAGYGFARLYQQHLGARAPVTSTLKPPGTPTATAADPFLGSPAQGYADGTAGIMMPPAQPVGGYSAAQVAAAYQTTKQMLIAAYLDRPTLAGGAPDAFASLLIPQQRTQFTAGLDKTGLNPSGIQVSTRAWVISFAPGTQLAGDVIKVHGTMQAETGSNGSYPVLQVHADYLFVYPVQRPGQPSTLMRIVERTVINVDFGAYSGPGSALQPWWQIVGGGPAGARCDVDDGFVHPQFPQGPAGKVQPKGTPINPYDQSTPPPGNGVCHATTGT